jgi:hypothetical protein
MTLLSRQVHRTVFSPSVLTSAERRWLRAAGIAGNVFVATVLAVSIVGFIILMDASAQQWFWENVFSQPWWPLPPIPK